MRYTKFGNTGLIVSRLAFGAMTFGKGEFMGFKYTVDQNEANRMVKHAIDAGINFFDTADMYAQGLSEEMLGKALKGRRDDVVITTKVGSRSGPAIVSAGLSYKHVIAAAESSLKRLGTEFIDLYLVHFDDRLTPFEETARALNNLVERGLVHYIGFSNLPAWQAASALAVQREHDYSPFISAQVNYNLLSRDVEHEIIPFIKKEKLGMMIWSPLAGGFLTGKYTAEDTDGGGGRLSTFQLMPLNKELGYKLVERLNDIARAHDATVAQVSLAWLLDKPHVSSPILGASKFEQLESNLGAIELKLTKQELEELDNFTAPAPIYPNWMYNFPTDPIVHEALHRK